MVVEQRTIDQRRERERRTIICALQKEKREFTLWWLCFCLSSIIKARLILSYNRKFDLYMCFILQSVNKAMFFF